MDPSCGKCLGSDCRGFAGSTDPDCPEHGTAAVAARQAELDREVAQLSAKSLRRLARAAPKPEPAPEWPFPECVPLPSTVQREVRAASERMVGLARSRRRRAKLFRVTGPLGRNPEKRMTPIQRELFRHFNKRVTVAFLELWREYGESEWEVWATW